MTAFESHMAPTVVHLAITPKTPADRQKLDRAIHALATEGGNLEVRPGIERGSTEIGAVSEAHLEATVDRLWREFEVSAYLGKPTVAYVETLTRSAEGSARHVRMAHSGGEYAHVALRLHPGEAGSGYSFEDATTGGAIPQRFMASIDNGIRESMFRGRPRGYPIVDVRVQVCDGSYHETDSTEAAFERAAAMAFQDAVKYAQLLVLEPVMHVVVRADNRHVNVVVESLAMRNGAIHDRAHAPDEEVITARVPLAELLGFESQLQAETHGHATCSIHSLTTNRSQGPPLMTTPPVLPFPVGRYQIFVTVRRPSRSLTTTRKPDHPRTHRLHPTGVFQDAARESAVVTRKAHDDEGPHLRWPASDCLPPLWCLGR
jgi:elongation factor G